MASIRDIFVRNMSPVWWGGVERESDPVYGKAVADANRNVKIATARYLGTDRTDEVAMEKAYNALEQARYNRAMLDNLFY